MNVIEDLIKEAPESSLAPLPRGHSEKMLSVNQEVSPHWTSNLPAP